VIGILGGIGSGKSTVAAEFAKLGCAVIDADKLAHQQLEIPETKQKIIESFGEDILDDNGNIDRKALGEIVFNDKEKLALLTEIIHQPVLEKTHSLIEQYRKDESVKAIVLDMPLLMEVGEHENCDTLIFVACDIEKRLERAKNSSIFSEKQLKIRENLQISLDIKANIAENTVDNNSGSMVLSRQISVLFPKIVENS
jgi:dephospho-CoA kinase